MMQSATEYLMRTESAVRRLFEGIDSYLDHLRAATNPVFISSERCSPAQGAEFKLWSIENAEKVAAARAAEQEFIAESFALDTLSGAGHWSQTQRFSAFLPSAWLSDPRTGG
jgi:hypothetical protein